MQSVKGDVKIDTISCFDIIVFYYIFWFGFYFKHVVEANMVNGFYLSIYHTDDCR